MKETDQISNSKIVGLSIGFLGIQLGFAIQAGNVTRILQSYGADLSQVSLFWLIAPLTGLIIQPIIGYISDRWINQGKTRIPFLLIGAILSTLTLCALPNADIFITMISPLAFGGIFIFLTDIAFNISIHPLRTTIPDYLPMTQQSRGFTIQTFLISTGAIIGSSLPYILNIFSPIDFSTATNQITNNVKYSFYTAGVTLLICMLINIKSILKIKSESIILPKKEITISKNKLSLKNIPKVIWKIGAIQFFSWSAFFLIWVFMIPALLNQFYFEQQIDPHSKTYNKVADYTGVLFAIYHFSAGLSALLLPYVYKKMNLITTHSLALFLGSIGLIWIYFSENIHNLYISMLLLGIAWASILASPFILLSKYIPKNTIGLYFGLFNCFITAPQIIVGIWSGIIIEKLFNNQAIYAIIMAAVSLLIAAIICLFFRKDFSSVKIHVQ